MPHNLFYTLFFTNKYTLVFARDNICIHELFTILDLTPLNIIIKSILKSFRKSMTIVSFLAMLF
jgi:hypothetical protein